MGNNFGLANQLVMLTTCIAIVLLVISGVMMWWKRRPTGRLATPARVSPTRIKGAVAILILAGVLFPILGMSVIAIFLIDRLVLLAAVRR
ncbi:hypothetical protein ASE69_00835 [Sphingomonas sp. Leaf208]|nr:hypothetical protein ASE69_00835 [Sphingomonas sp. Leaf208]